MIIFNTQKSNLLLLLGYKPATNMSKSFLFFFFSILLLQIKLLGEKLSINEEM